MFHDGITHKSKQSREPWSLSVTVPCLTPTWHGCKSNGGHLPAQKGFFPPSQAGMAGLTWAPLHSCSQEPLGKRDIPECCGSLGPKWAQTPAVKEGRTMLRHRGEEGWRMGGGSGERNGHPPATSLETNPLYSSVVKKRKRGSSC